MSKTTEEQIAELRERDIERQWIESYKKYRRLVKKAEAELSEEE